MKNKRKKLIAGIVLTGGGSQLNHLKQLVEYITGMDTRIGYPNEHLAGDSDTEMASPLYATAVGLVMNAVENQSKVIIEEEVVEQPIETISDAETSIDDDTEHTNAPIQSEPKKERKSIFEKWADKLKDFLDNAE